MGLFNLAHHKLFQNGTTNDQQLQKQLHYLHNTQHTPTKKQS